MRQIRFRGKESETGKWIEGYYAVHHIEELDAHDKVLGYKEVHCIFNDEPGNRSKGGYWHNINPKTLCQFTGSYDMAGKSIYEGDIVEKQSFPHMGRKRTVICCENGAFMTDEPEGHAIDVVLASDMYRAWCVIGNVYDNPGWAMED